MRLHVKRILACIYCVPLLILAGCSSSDLQESLPDQRLVYKKQREATENLEIPPDLTAGNFDDALDIPGGVAQPTTFSEYAGNRENRQQVAASGQATVLPTVQNVELKRRGAERWLEVQATPQLVWPRLIAFWREQGILLTEQNPTLGVMRTDWLDNRAEIRKDFVTRMVSKIAEGMYSTSNRDQYNVRIEEGLKSGTTDIRLTHRSMAERVVTDTLSGTQRTIWEPSASDSEKEAEMLRRLMVYLGADPKKAASPATPDTTTDATTEQPVQSRSRLIAEQGVPVIVIPQELRAAWRLTGTALDRADFTVEDRDQTQGVYYVRYASRRGEADDDAAEGEKTGLLSRLAFWRDTDDADGIKPYQIKVSGNEHESRVMVLKADGKPDASTSGQRILGLIQEQMR